jgi:predicted nucleic acid-binding protein
MGSLDLSDLPDHALLLIDSAPIIYFLEDHPKFGPRFAPIFEQHGAGAFQFAVTTVTIAEVMTGPLGAGEEAVARRYRSILESWKVVVLDSDIAEHSARLRATFGLKLADAVQVASALALNADALVTHDRDFSRVTGIRVIS